MTRPDQTRQHYFDFLRVFAAFGVMFLHVSAQNWYTTDVYSFEWIVMNIYDNMATWPVRIFVMISGALFLSRDIPIKKLYGKYILRIFTAFIFWSSVYAMREYVKTGKATAFLYCFFVGHYHMWFMFMIVGLYVIVPFMKKIAESEFLTKYFLLSVLAFSIIVPDAVKVIAFFSEKYGVFADTLAKKFIVYLPEGYIGYFLLGYFLNNLHISRRAKRILYTAGIAGLLANIIMSCCASWFKGEPSGSICSLGTAFEAVALFIYFKEKFSFPAKIIRILSQYSFGAYLVHVVVILTLKHFGLNTLTFSPVLSIPVICVIVFFISFAISAILNHIPVLNKYIV